MSQFGGRCTAEMVSFLFNWKLEQGFWCARNQPIHYVTGRSLITYIVFGHCLAQGWVFLKGSIGTQTHRYMYTKHYSLHTHMLLDRFQEMKLIPLHPSMCLDDGCRLYIVAMFVLYDSIIRGKHNQTIDWRGYCSSVLIKNVPRTVWCGDKKLEILYIFHIITVAQPTLIGIKWTFFHLHLARKITVSLENGLSFANEIDSHPGVAIVGYISKYNIEQTKPWYGVNIWFKVG